MKRRLDSVWVAEVYGSTPLPVATSRPDRARPIARIHDIISNSALIAMTRGMTPSPTVDSTGLAPRPQSSRVYGVPYEPARRHGRSWTSVAISGARGATGAQEKLHPASAERSAPAGKALRS